MCRMYINVIIIRVDLYLKFEMNWRTEDYESAGFSFEKACIDSETSK